MDAIVHDRVVIIVSVIIININVIVAIIILILVMVILGPRFVVVVVIIIHHDWVPRRDDVGRLLPFGHKIEQIRQSIHQHGGGITHHGLRMHNLYREYHLDRGKGKKGQKGDPE